MTERAVPLVGRIDGRLDGRLVLRLALRLVGRTLVASVVAGGLLLGGARTCLTDPAGDTEHAEDSPTPELLATWTRHLSGLGPAGPVPVDPVPVGPSPVGPLPVAPVTVRRGIAVADVSGCQASRLRHSRTGGPREEMLVPDHRFVRWSPDGLSAAFLDRHRGDPDANLWLYTARDSSLVHDPGFGAGTRFVDLVWLDDRHLALTTLFPVTPGTLHLSGTLYDVGGKHAWYVTFEDPAGLTPLLEEPP